MSQLGLFVTLLLLGGARAPEPGETFPERTRRAPRTLYLSPQQEDQIVSQLPAVDVAVPEGRDELLARAQTLSRRRAYCRASDLFKAWESSRPTDQAPEENLPGMMGQSMLLCAQSAENRGDLSEAEKRLEEVLNSGWASKEPHEFGAGLRNRQLREALEQERLAEARDYAVKAREHLEKAPALWAAEFKKNKGDELARWAERRVGEGKVRLGERAAQVLLEMVPDSQSGVAVLRHVMWKYRLLPWLIAAGAMGFALVAAMVLFRRKRGAGPT